MARYTGPSCRLCRREGIKLFLKGDRCYSDKCAMNKRNKFPGQHGEGRRGRVSNYGIQLREKQKVKRFYGLQEKQFKDTFLRAARQEGIAGENLLQALEMRLDNTVFRLGMANSRKEARQLVNHGHFRLNGKKADIASIKIKEGDVISVKETSRKSEKFKALQEKAQNTPAWLEMDWDNFSGKVVRLPNREDIDLPISEHLITELYSR
ncbi:MAG TPA: 30S ribosomal protein S4 [Tissierellia bacterium]|jgi:small subunit ribosomal protein S4|nr:30S ribosomal protein S4 [Tissierellia bacterium]